MEKEKELYTQEEERLYQFYKAFEEFIEEC